MLAWLKMRLFGNNKALPPVSTGTEKQCVSIRNINS